MSKAGFAEILFCGEQAWRDGSRYPTAEGHRRDRLSIQQHPLVDTRDAGKQRRYLGLDADAIPSAVV